MKSQTDPRLRTIKPASMRLTPSSGDRSALRSRSRPAAPFSLATVMALSNSDKATRLYIRDRGHQEAGASVASADRFGPAPERGHKA